MNTILSYFHSFVIQFRRSEFFDFRSFLINDVSIAISENNLREIKVIRLNRLANLTNLSAFLTVLK